MANKTVNKSKKLATPKVSLSRDGYKFILTFSDIDTSSVYKATNIHITYSVIEAKDKVKNGVYKNTDSGSATIGACHSSWSFTLDKNKYYPYVNDGGDSNDKESDYSQRISGIYFQVWVTGGTISETTKDSKGNKTTTNYKATPSDVREKTFTFDNAVDPAVDIVYEQDGTTFTYAVDINDDYGIDDNSRKVATRSWVWLTQATYDDQNEKVVAGHAGKWYDKDKAVNIRKSITDKIPPDVPIKYTVYAYSAGPGGKSEVKSKYHVNARPLAPNAPTFTRLSTTVNSEGQDCNQGFYDVSWNIDTDNNWRPVDTVTVQYRDQTQHKVASDIYGEDMGSWSTAKGNIHYTINRIQTDDLGAVANDCVRYFRLLVEHDGIQVPSYVSEVVDYGKPSNVTGVSYTQDVITVGDVQKQVLSFSWTSPSTKLYNATDKAMCARILIFKNSDATQPIKTIYYGDEEWKGDTGSWIYEDIDIDTAMTFCFQVRVGYDNMSPGAKSDNYWTSDIIVPGKITNVKGTKWANNTTVEVTWNNPTEEDTLANGVEVAWSTSPTAWESNSQPSTVSFENGAATKAYINDLTAGETYYFWVRRYEISDGNYNYGIWSDVSKGVLLADEPDIPILSTSRSWIKPGGSLVAQWVYSASGNLPQLSAQVEVGQNVDFKAMVYDDFVKTGKFIEALAGYFNELDNPINMKKGEPYLIYFRNISEYWLWVATKDFTCYGLEKSTGGEYMIEFYLGEDVSEDEKYLRVSRDAMYFERDSIIYGDHVINNQVDIIDLDEIKNDMTFTLDKTVTLNAGEMYCFHLWFNYNYKSYNNCIMFTLSETIKTNKVEVFDIASSLTVTKIKFFIDDVTPYEEIESNGALITFSNPEEDTNTYTFDVKNSSRNTTLIVINSNVKYLFVFETSNPVYVVFTSETTVPVTEIVYSKGNGTGPVTFEAKSVTADGEVSTTYISGTAYASIDDLNTGLGYVPSDPVTVTAKTYKTYESIFGWTPMAYVEGEEYRCTIDFNKMVNNAYIYTTGEYALRVIVKNSLGNTASEKVKLLIAEQPTCSLSSQSIIEYTYTALTGDGGSSETITTNAITEMPMLVTVSGDGDLNLYIYCIDDFEWSHPDKSQYIYKGDCVWTAPVQPGTIEITNAPLADNSKYRLQLECVDPGTNLSAESKYIDFEVHWSHQAIAPMDSKVSINDEGHAILTAVKPEGANDTDVCDIYRSTADGRYICCKGVAFGTSIEDILPTFGHAFENAYCFCTRTTEGDEAWSDIEYEYDGSGVIVNFGSDVVALPWNVTINDDRTKQGEVRAHLGGTKTYFGKPYIERKQSISTDMIKLTNEDIIEKLYSLSRYTRLCYVRCSNGVGYPAVVDVSLSREYNKKIVSASLSATEVDSDEFVSDGTPIKPEYNIIEVVYYGNSSSISNNEVMQLTTPVSLTAGETYVLHVHAADNYDSYIPFKAPQNAQDIYRVGINGLIGTSILFYKKSREDEYYDIIERDTSGSTSPPKIEAGYYIFNSGTSWDDETVGDAGLVDFEPGLTYLLSFYERDYGSIESDEEMASHYREIILTAPSDYNCKFRFWRLAKYQSGLDLYTKNFEITFFGPDDDALGDYPDISDPLPTTGWGIKNSCTFTVDSCPYYIIIDGELVDGTGPYYGVGPFCKVTGSGRYNSIDDIVI